MHQVPAEVHLPRRLLTSGVAPATWPPRQGPSPSPAPFMPGMVCAVTPGRPSCPWNPTGTLGKGRAPTSSWLNLSSICASCPRAPSGPGSRPPKAPTSHVTQDASRLSLQARSSAAAPSRAAETASATIQLQQKARSRGQRRRLHPPALSTTRRDDGRTRSPVPCATQAQGCSRSSLLGHGGRPVPVQREPRGSQRAPCPMWSKAGCPPSDLPAPEFPARSFLRGTEGGGRGAVLGIMGHSAAPMASTLWLPPSPPRVVMTRQTLPVPGGELVRRGQSPPAGRLEGSSGKGFPERHQHRGSPGSRAPGAAPQPSHLWWPSGV